VPYSDKFYADLAARWPNDNPFVQLAYHNDVLVGAICAREEVVDVAAQEASGLPHIYPDVTPGFRVPGDSGKGKSKKSAHRVYIMTLSVLAPYRRRGVASGLLKHIVAAAEANPQIDHIYLHVHTENAEAIAFYLKHGFKLERTIENYYRNPNVKPPHCHLFVYRCSHGKSKPTEK